MHCCGTQRKANMEELPARSCKREANTNKCAGTPSMPSMPSVPTPTARCMQESASIVAADAPALRAAGNFDTVALTSARTRTHARTHVPKANEHTNKAAVMQQDADGHTNQAAVMQQYADVYTNKAAEVQQ